MKEVAFLLQKSRLQDRRGLHGDKESPSRLVRLWIKFREIILKTHEFIVQNCSDRMKFLSIQTQTYDKIAMKSII